MPVSVDYSAAIAAVRSYGEQLMADFSIPGISVGLTDRDQLIATIELGYANVAKREPVLPATEFGIGSITKTFTGILMLKLQELGLVDLQRPVVEYLPWFSVRAKWAPFTLAHLLSHTSGLPNPTMNHMDHTSYIAALANANTGSEPGTYWHYSNVGYDICGVIAEKVTGKPYAALVKEYIFDALGMTESQGATIDDGRDRLATGYRNKYGDRPILPEHGIVEAPFYDFNDASGCITSSSRDMTKFLGMLLNGGAYAGGRIISEKSFTELIKPRGTAEPGTNYGYGYGLDVPAKEGQTWFGHDGAMTNYASGMRGDRNWGVGAVALTNGPWFVIPYLAEYAKNCLHAAIEGKEMPEPPVLVDPIIKPNWARTWYGTSGNIEIFIDDDGDLFINDGEIKGKLKEAAWEELLLDQPGHNLWPLQLALGESAGEPAMLTWGSRVFSSKPLVEPVETTPSSPDSSKEIPAELAAVTGHYTSFSPWSGSKRVFLREGELHIVEADYIWGEDPEILTPIPAAELDGETGWFRKGDEPRNPERYRFTTFIDGIPRIIEDEVGNQWHRHFTA